MSKYTFKQFQAEYPNDAACLGKLMEFNFGGTEIICPACGARTTFHMMSARRAFACQDCGHHVYPCAGTIFHKSSTKLTVWFFAMYLMTSTCHGVAAKEIERQTGVTYKCAWRICHELRKLMAAADHRGPLGGNGKHVEIDETLLVAALKGKDAVGILIKRSPYSAWSIAEEKYPERSKIKQRPQSSLSSLSILPKARSFRRICTALIQISVMHMSMALSIIKPMNGYAAFTIPTQSKGIGRSSSAR